MNAKAFALAGLAGSFVLAGAASASFVDVTIVPYIGAGWAENGYTETGITTFRMYANFTGEEGDGVLSVFGLPDDILSVSSDSGYHNADMFAGDTAPTDLTGLGIWDNQWDTYVTIGVTSDDGDMTTTSPGFTTITGGLSQDFTLDNGGWFVTPIDTQAEADENNQVLLAQFSAPGGGDGVPLFEGNINLLLLNAENEFGIAYSTPAPGALALLGLAGIVGTRRRRA